MLKDIIVLELNSKKGVLGQVELKTPNEFMFANETEQILNCHVFEDFIDGMFAMTIEELAYDFDKKIDNVFITFINENDEFVCSVIIDRFKPKKMTYRMRLQDWQSSEYTFKYVGRGNNLNDFDNDLKPEF